MRPLGLDNRCKALGTYAGPNRQPLPGVPGGIHRLNSREAVAYNCLEGLVNPKIAGYSFHSGLGGLTGLIHHASEPQGRRGCHARRAEQLRPPQCAHMKVGVKNIRYPNTLHCSATGGVMHTVASVNMYVGLPHYQKGTHMRLLPGSAQ